MLAAEEQQRRDQNQLNFLHRQQRNDRHELEDLLRLKEQGNERDMKEINNNMITKISIMNVAKFLL